MSVPLWCFRQIALRQVVLDWECVGRCVLLVTWSELMTLPYMEPYDQHNAMCPSMESCHSCFPC